MPGYGLLASSRQRSQQQQAAQQLQTAAAHIRSRARAEVLIFPVACVHVYLLVQSYTMAGNDDSDLYRMVLAAQEGRAGEVGALSRSLVAGKADINDDGIFGLPALCWAAWNNHAPVVSALLQAGAACEYRPLWVASLQGSTDCNRRRRGAVGWQGRPQRSRQRAWNIGALGGGR